MTTAIWINRKLSTMCFDDGTTDSKSHSSSMSFSGEKWLKHFMYDILGKSRASIIKSDFYHLGMVNFSLDMNSPVFHMRFLHGFNCILQQIHNHLLYLNFI